MNARRAPVPLLCAALLAWASAPGAAREQGPYSSGVEEDAERARKLARSGARALAPDRAGADLPDAGSAVPGVGPAEAVRGRPDYDSLNRAERDRQAGLAIGGLPIPDQDFHALASAEVAPKPGWGASVGAALFRDGATVAEDIAAARGIAGQVQLQGQDAQPFNAYNQNGLQAFFDWVKSVPEGRLPNIGYGTLEAGEIGRYKRALLGKSGITLNYHIRAARKEERAVVLLHELYHYWDFEVARNDHENSAYGYIDPASKWKAELDPYWITSVSWQAGRPPSDPSSPLGRFLDGLPKTRAEVEAAVERALAPGGR